MRVVIKNTEEELTGKTIRKKFMLRRVVNLYHSINTRQFNDINEQKHQL